MKRGNEMAIIDRVKFDGLGPSTPWLVYKYPGETFVIGSQLIVNEGQVAAFYKGGQVLNIFGPGTHTLNTGNLPIIKSIINIPFGGKTPFSAEIYYINTTSKLDILWGTTDPIQVIDPKFNVKLNVRAFGRFGIKILDYRKFLKEIVGVLSSNEFCDYNKVSSYFKGILISKVKTLIAKNIINKRISALEISACLEDISKDCAENISGEFDRLGIQSINFIIESINFPDEDFAQINNILENQAELNIMGDERYATKRSYEIMEKAAINPGAGNITAAGIGLGVGANLGNVFGNKMNDVNQNVSGIKKRDIDTIVCHKCHFANTGKVKFCGECGERLVENEIVCSQCGESNSADRKFCKECGASLLEIKCKECGFSNETSVKFCGNCGAKLRCDK